MVLVKISERIMILPNRVLDNSRSISGIDEPKYDLIFNVYTVHYSHSLVHLETLSGPHDYTLDEFCEEIQSGRFTEVLAKERGIEV